MLFYEMRVTFNQTTRRHVQNRFDVYENARVLADENRHIKFRNVIRRQIHFSHVFLEVAV